MPQSNTPKVAKNTATRKGPIVADKVVIVAQMAKISSIQWVTKAKRWPIWWCTHSCAVVIDLAQLW
jgi:hypothetical protein